MAASARRAGIMAPAEGRVTGRAATIVVIILCGVFAVLAFTTAGSKSATFDEVKHLPAGYLFLQGDYRLDLDNPPLARMIAAAPLLLAPVRFDASDPTVRESRVWRFGHRFLYEWNDADTLLARGRMAITLVAIGLIVAIFLWTRRHWGAAPAVLAAVFAAFSPDLLAHGSLATTDLVLAALFFLTVIAFERLTERVTPLRLAATGVALGAALASKYSAVVLLPVLGLLAIAEAWRDRTIECAWSAHGGAIATAATRSRRLRLLAGLFVAAGLVAAATIWTVYRWRFAPTASSASSAAAPPGAVAAGPHGSPAPLEWERTAAEHGAIGSLLRAARDAHLLPEAYLHGFLDMLRSGRAHRSFVLGETHTGGVWYFFPLTLAVKTPPGLLMLAAAGFGLALLPATRRRVDLFLWLPPLVFFALAVAHGLNIGHRHLLPLCPFLFIAAGRCAAWPLARPAPRLRRLLVGAAAGSCAIVTLARHPDHLAYFNQFAGGSSNAHRLLVDSNLDWGQDLKGLAAWLRREPGPRPKVSYFGTADPAYYGIECDFLPSEMRPMPERVEWTVRRGDRLAVSATNLHALYIDPAAGPLMALLRERRPRAVIGGSIFIYDADFDWRPVGGHGVSSAGNPGGLP